MPNEFTVVVERDDEWFIAFYPEIPGAIPWTLPAAGAARRRIWGVGFDENPYWPVAGRALGGCYMPRDARAYLSEINGR